MERRETPRSAQAFADYVALGPGRSLRALVEQYRVQTATKPPTTRLETLAGWSTRHRWQERLAGAITAQTEAALARSRKLDALAFLRTSELLARRLASGEPLPLEALIRIRESVRRPEPRPAGIALSATLRDAVERVAAQRGLDPADVLAEAERIIAEGA